MMKKILILLSMGILLCLSSCASPVATEPPGAFVSAPAPRDGAPPAESALPEGWEENPYDDISDATFFGCTQHTIFELTRGAERLALPDKELVYLRTEQSPVSDWRAEYEIRYPNFSEDTAAAGEMNRFFRARYEEDRANMEAACAAWLEACHAGLSPWGGTHSICAYDAYRWGGFTTVITENFHHFGRGCADPVPLTFRTETGAPVKLADLFAAEVDYTSALHTRLENARWGNWEDDPPEDWRHTMLPGEGGYGAENFLVTPRGIVFVYGTGEAASMAGGPMFLCLPYDEIADILNPDWFACALDYTPALRVSDPADRPDLAVIATRAGSDTPSEQEQSVLLWSEERLAGLLVSYAVPTEPNDPFGEFIEIEALQYLSELPPGQTIALKVSGGGDDEGVIRVGYTNGAGRYETVVLSHDSDSEAVRPVPVGPGLTGRTDLRADMAEWEARFLSDDFRVALQSGVFDHYVPLGMRIIYGSLGDVNADGISDALLCLHTAGHHVAMNGGIVPMLILTGRQGGGYDVAQSIPDALFYPYRSSARPEAGRWHIDLVYDYVGGAACSHQAVVRFDYDADHRDWYLSAYSYRHRGDLLYGNWLLPELIHPPARVVGTPLSAFEREMLREEEVAPDGYDASAALTVEHGELLPITTVYTILVSKSGTAGYYEGYILSHTSYSHRDNTITEYGDVVQTIRGKYTPGTRLTVTANSEKLTFSVGSDVWRFGDDSGTCAGFFRGK